MTKSQNSKDKQIPMKTEISKQTERQRGLEFETLVLFSDFGIIRFGIVLLRNRVANHPQKNLMMISPKKILRFKDKIRIF
jgi:hypothetical protein